MPALRRSGRTHAGSWNKRNRDRVLAVFASPLAGRLGLQGAPENRNLIAQGMTQKENGQHSDDLVRTGNTVCLLTDSRAEKAHAVKTKLDKEKTRECVKVYGEWPTARRFCEVVLMSWKDSEVNLARLRGRGGEWDGWPELAQHGNDNRKMREREQGTPG